MSFVVISLGVTSLVFLLVHVAGQLASRFGASRAVPGSLAVAATYGNVGYLGVPIVLSVVGAPAALGAALGQLLHNLLFMIGYPVLRSLRRSEPMTQGRTSGLRGVLWRVLKGSLLLNPVVIGVVGGMLVGFFQIQLPESLISGVELLGQAAVPVAMFAVGLGVKPAFDGVRSGEIPITEVLGVSFVKLLVLPLGTLAAAFWLAPDLGLHWAAAAVIMAAMPVSSTANILVFEYDGDVRTVGAATVVTSVAAIVTIPLILSLII